MDCLALLERFAKYVEFDVDQRSFNVNSRNYRMSHALNRVPEINEYDPTGALALLYVKSAFRDELDSTRVSLLDAISSPAAFEPDRQMWASFTSDEVQEVERSLVRTIGDFTTKVVGTPLVGPSSDLIAKISTLIEDVVDGLHKCNIHVWLTDETAFGDVGDFSSVVHVYGTLAEALACLSMSDDGIKLCYVKQERTSDGFFGFFVKSGRNLVSVDDFIMEPYPGQHGNTRNGRYLESKSFDLFPYQNMIEFDKPDYKGYYTEYIINDSDLSFLAFGEDVYLPIALSMSCVRSMLSGRVFAETSQLYVDSLLPERLALPDSAVNALSLREDHPIVVANSTVDLSGVTTESVLAGDVPSDDKRLSRLFANTEPKQLAIGLFARDFELDQSKLLAQARAMFGRDGDWTGEFVATADRMRAVAFAQGREQLAKSITDGLSQELESFGGISGVSQWYHDALMRARDHIAALCARAYSEMPQPVTEDELYYFNECTWFDGFPGVRMDSVCNGCLYRVKRPYSGIDSVIPLNDIEHHPVYDHSKTVTQLEKCGMAPVPAWLSDMMFDKVSIWYTAQTITRVLPYCNNLLSHDGKRCSVIFGFVPRTAEDIAMVLDCAVSDLPPIVQTWVSFGSVFEDHSNFILELTDPLTRIYHPLTRVRSSFNSNLIGYDFKFQIGFTKREIKALVKELDKATTKGVE